MTTHGADTFTWYPFDLPKTLAAGTKSAEFFYGVGRERYKQVQKTGSTTDATIYYVGSLFEKEVAASTTYRHYVSARGRTLASVNRVGTTNTVQYLHRDHQGSVVEVTGSTGALVQSLAFDAWGLRRNAATWAALGSPFAGTQPTERGYTGHEHLDAVELIHMNGRVQDPRLGRFISADPTVPEPFHSQSFDRYSYVWNNPVSLIDPSGFNPACPGWGDCTPLPIPDQSSGRFGNPAAGLWRLIPCTEFGEHVCQAMRDGAAAAAGPAGGSEAGIPTTAGSDATVSPPAWSIQTSFMPGEHGWGGVDAMDVADIVTDYIPVVGQIKGIYGAYRVLTDDDASTLDKVIAVGGIVPFGKAIKHVGAAAKGIASKIDRAAFRKEREAYWKREAEGNPGRYSEADLARMRDGGAPVGPDGKPMELHHRDGTPDGPLDPMSRTDHRSGENYKKNHPWLGD